MRRLGRFHRALAVLSIAASLGAFATHTAFADPSDADINLARTLGQQATEAFTNKDHKKAKDLFRRAHDLYKAAPTLSVGLARALAADKKYVEAAETYNRVIREGVPASASPAFKDAVGHAQAEINDVTPKIAKVTISVTAVGGGDVTSPDVKVDGETMNNAGLGVQRPIDPGTHKVTVTAVGFKAAEKSFTVGEGQATDAPIQLEKDSGAVALPTTTPTVTTTATGNPPGPETPASGGSKVPAIVAFGVGGLGLVAGIVTGAIALGDHSTLQKECPTTTTCPSTASSDLSSYHSIGTISTIGFVVAGVGAAAGVVLLLTAGGSSSNTQKASITPYIGVGSFGAVGRF